MTYAIVNLNIKTSSVSERSVTVQSDALITDLKPEDEDFLANLTDKNAL